MKPEDPSESSRLAHATFDAKAGLRPGSQLCSYGRILRESSGARDIRVTGPAAGDRSGEA
jgi:hypothetical protein